MAVDAPITKLPAGRLPSLVGVYGRMVLRELTRRGREAAAGPLPRAAVGVDGVRIDPAHLARYRAECGLAEGPFLPITYLQAITAGLGGSLLLVPGVRVGRGLGLVHVGSRIVERRPIRADERLDIVSELGEVRESERGIEGEFSTRVTASGDAAWDGVTAVMWRLPHERTPAATPPPVLEGVHRRWVLDAAAGRRYARVSGDWNPIHLWPMTARPLGFRRPIAHGLLLLARIVGELGPEAPACPRVLEARFKRPVLLPAEADLVLSSRAGAVDFALLASDGQKSHLEGRLARA